MDEEAAAGILAARTQTSLTILVEANHLSDRTGEIGAERHTRDFSRGALGKHARTCAGQQSSVTTAALAGIVGSTAAGSCDCGGEASGAAGGELSHFRLDCLRGDEGGEDGGEKDGEQGESHGGGGLVGFGLVVVVVVVILRLAR